MRQALAHAPFLRRALTCLLLLFMQAALAQISVPTFGTRGGVPSEVVEQFMPTFRGQLGRLTGLEVRSGQLITPGIAGSLDPEFAVLIADLDGARYAISGEIAAAVNTGGEPYAVNHIVVDAERDRRTDLITVPLRPSDLKSSAAELAASVAVFTSAAVELPAGDAALFVSSEPGDAQVFVDGVSIGRTSQLDVAMLAPGRYRLEVRKEGFLPDSRMVVLRAGDTSFVHVVLTAISGGSIRSCPCQRAGAARRGRQRHHAGGVVGVAGYPPDRCSATASWRVHRGARAQYLVTRVESTLARRRPAGVLGRAARGATYTSTAYPSSRLRRRAQAWPQDHRLVGPQGTRSFLRAVPVTACSNSTSPRASSFPTALGRVVTLSSAPIPVAARPSTAHGS